jgi:hypothetical protein
VQTISELDYVKTWALYALCAAVGGFIAGAVAGGVLGAILGASGWSANSIALAAGLTGFILSLPISYFFFRFFVARLLASKGLQSGRADAGAI